MSGKTQLFVSHSSHSQESLTRLTELCDALSAAGYEVLYDKEMIESSDDWRRVIHCALAQCHAALILFDRKALSSPWVLKEATILAWRRDLEGDDFRLLPVRLPPIEPEDLEAKNFAPLLINATQHVPSGEVADIVAAVEGKVAKNLSAPTLFDFLTAAIADQLEGLPGENLLSDVAARCLGGLPAMPGASRKTRFAAALAKHIFRTGPGSLAEAVEILSQFGPTLDDRIAQRILNTLQPMWVEEDAAACLADARYSALALHSQRYKIFAEFTAENYAARCHARSKLWVVVHVDEANGTDRVEHIRSCVRSELQEKRLDLGFYEGDELDAEIRKLRDPIFVILPWVLEQDELSQLSSAASGYPNMKYLMWSAQRAQSGAALPSGARYVTPELPPEVEREALRAYGRAQQLVQALSRSTGGRR